MAAVEQELFDFASGQDAGYRSWQLQQEKHLESIRREWNVPIGSKVRVRLRNIDNDFVGVLRLGVMPITIDRRLPLTLRLDSMTFDRGEIEYLSIA